MAFCNAGFATLPGDDLISYAGNWLIVVALVHDQATSWGMDRCS
jgi:hypothetical protein